jgi:tetratricopeptide (TPR) repeat protein
VRALASCVGLAAVGALVAHALAKGVWDLVGLETGAVTACLAPLLYAVQHEQSEARKLWCSSSEHPLSPSSARLLNPLLKVVDFVGRKTELASLMSWCMEPSASRLRLITGPGGVGKTRLAVELVARLKKLGWTCRWVADGREGEVIGIMRAVTRHGALLVVDYAETRAGLRQMLNALAGDQGDNVRVLLLARSAGDWWDQLGAGEPIVRDLVQAATPAQMLSSVLSDDLSDQDIVNHAVAAFARALDVPERAVEIASDDMSSRRVLDLHAAALVGVLAEKSSATVRVDISMVLEELLKHEKRIWYESARAAGLTEGSGGLSAEMIRQSVAVVCLVGAATEEEARALPSRVPGLAASANVARWLREVYPPTLASSDWLGSPQPDRLAGMHVVRELAASPELAQACLSGLNAKQAQRAVTLLSRASSDSRQAEALLVQLRHNLGVRLSELGHPAKALPVMQDAVVIRRELAAASPDRYRPALARALSNLGATLVTLGRPGDALQVNQEAVTMYWKLAVVTPDDYYTELAQAMANIEETLAMLGCPADALPAKAVAMFGLGAAVNPARYRVYLARSLNNLGFRLATLGRPAEALPVIRAAVAMHRELAGASRDPYHPDLAQSVANLGITLRMLDRPARALPVLEEAVAMCRELAAARPNRYPHVLVRSLDNLEVVFRSLGQHAAANAAQEEAAKIRWQFGV